MLSVLHNPCFYIQFFNTSAVHLFKLTILPSFLPPSLLPSFPPLLSFLSSFLSFVFLQILKPWLCTGYKLLVVSTRLLLKSGWRHQEIGQGEPRTEPWGTQHEDGAKEQKCLCTACSLPSLPRFQVPLALSVLPSWDPTESQYVLHIPPAKWVHWQAPRNTESYMRLPQPAGLSPIVVIGSHRDRHKCRSWRLDQRHGGLGG